MQTVTEIQALRAAVRGWRASGQAVGLVPTMGNLHEGHFSLLKQARARCDRVVASVFVNPTQFGPGEDFERYPRTLAQDQVGLAEHDCDLVFAPSVETMYPFGPEHSVRVQVPRLTETLEGAHRPGHFDGMATVVCKLFNLVQPDVAVFGQKDFQQLRVIERFVRDLGLPVTVLAAPIVRESDGLAMSSRNQYLSPEERQRAVGIHRTLQAMKVWHVAGRSPQAIEQEAAAQLRELGFEPDYAAVRRSADLALPEHGEREHLVALIAARLGSTRLIDNLLLD
ncbi:pantoate--beta-alanine ligase [Oleiagrimonas soli]|uniref:Pantothenate synthetase n=1 Tax=Oleiagrimonas soli TaxID=1543381 RepID=A0A099CXY3_9GAMM|nr:pantoate--beta-alanine ligase [Oleiagrimonas soli]KGI77905.1 pantoate--beta-alanine ligase [Oleiagrimonas soli]MBB6183728.1 pantoate--beta-alanine ligase [Oleiagrimonas soli]